MRTIGFIGAYDKIDCMLYIAKIIRSVGQRVLLIDASELQKARYTVPAVENAPSYITEFEEIDVAVGFRSMEAIKKYLSIPENGQLNYDICLINVETDEAFENFEIQQAEKKYFVTGFDLYTLKKGLEAVSEIDQPINMTKVLFSKYMSREENDYLDYLASEYKIVWDENRVYFPIENGDASIIADNQRVAKIKLKSISTQYKEGLLYIAEDILGEYNVGQLRKVMKMIERGV